MVSKAAVFLVISIATGLHHTARATSGCNNRAKNCLTRLRQTPFFNYCTGFLTREKAKQDCALLCGYCTPCVDKGRSKTCKELRQKGQCASSKWHKYININCQRTCGICKDGHQHLTTDLPRTRWPTRLSTNQRTKTRQPIRPMTRGTDNHQGTCTDTIQACQSYAEKGFCTDDDMMHKMRIHCKRSCNWCTMTRTHQRTNAPRTGALSTHVPSTHVPSTSVPSTHVPSTSVPSTHVPSTSVPSTGASITHAPSMSRGHVTQYTMQSSIKGMPTEQVTAYSRKKSTKNLSTSVKPAYKTTSISYTTKTRKTITELQVTTTEQGSFPRTQSTVDVSKPNSPILPGAKTSNTIQDQTPTTETKTIKHRTRMISKLATTTTTEQHSSVTTKHHQSSTIAKNTQKPTGSKTENPLTTGPSIINTKIDKTTGTLHPTAPLTTITSSKELQTISKTTQNTQSASIDTETTSKCKDFVICGPFDIMSCGDPQMRETLIKKCPYTCGFC